MRKRSEKIREFILAYVIQHGWTSATDEKFHDAYTNAFGGKRKAYLYGAQPNYSAMRWLARLEAEGFLHRQLLSNCALPGFGKWEYLYGMPARHFR